MNSGNNRISEETLIKAAHSRENPFFEKISLFFERDIFFDLI